MFLEYFGLPIRMENMDILQSIIKFRNREYRASQINNTSRSSKISLKSNCSTDSYVSAVSSSNLIGEDEIDGRQEINRKPLVDPSLISAYTNYMQPVTCINWRQNVPGTRNKFSLLKNLKVSFIPFINFFDVVRISLNICKVDKNVRRRCQRKSENTCGGVNFVIFPAMLHP